MKNIVVAFSGPIASGKTSISTLVAQKLGVQRVSFGDYVRGVAQFLGLDSDDRESLQDLGAFLVKRPTIFCRKVLAQARYQAGETIVVDGVRHEQILDELVVQSAPATVVLVYVTASDEIIERRKYDGGRLTNDIGQGGNHSTELQVDTILPNRADFAVTNENDSVEAQADAIVKWLLQRNR